MSSLLNFEQIIDYILILFEMVKGYDQTQNDPTKMLLDKIFKFVDPNFHTISPKLAASLFSSWLQTDTSTSCIYKQFNQLNVKPKIMFHQTCQSPFWSTKPYNGDKYFGAYQKYEEIHVCLNHIRNKIELKENLDRELHIMNKLANIGENQSQSDRERKLMQSLYESCQEGYRNYQWEQNTLKRASKKCAVYLFRRRSQSNLPPDSLFRYASRAADQYCI